MARVDGAIFLEVNLDISQAEKALAQLKLKITALESQILRMSRAPHNDWFKSSLDTLERLKAQAGQMEKTVRRQSRAAAAGGGQDAKKAQDKAAAPQPGPPVQAGKVSAEAPGGGGKGAGKTGSAAQQALAAFQKLPAKIARGADLAGKLNAFALASEHLGGVFQRLGGILKSLPAFSVVQQSFAAVGQQLRGYLAADKQIAAALGRLNGVLLTAAQPIYAAMLPALAALIDLMTRVGAVAGRFASALFGKTAQQSQADAKALYGQAGGGSAGGAAEPGAPTFDYDYGGQSAGSWGQAFAEMADTVLGSAVPQLQAGLAAFSGWMNGFSGRLYEMFTFPGLQEKVQQIGQQLAAALNNMVGSIDWNLLGAGLNLAVLGMADFLYTFDWTGFGMGLAALISGAVSAVDWNAAGLLLWSGFKLALETLAGLLLALDMTGLAGAASSLVTGFFNAMTQTLQTIEWQAVGEQIRLFLTGLDWQGIANSVFEAIGQAFQAALEFVSGLLGTDLLAEVISEGLTKILELLTAFADWVAGNQEAISNIAAVVGFFAAAFGLVNAAVTLWTAISAVAAAGTVALGAAIAFLTSPIGLAVAAVGAIIAVVALLVKNWDSVKAAAGSAWDAIVQRWSAAGKWFDSAVAQPMRNILNQIIRAINAVIGGFNRISFRIPDWAPIGAGQTFGLNIPKIPALAAGAAIPPNREFLAVLGDQRSGTNIEAPLAIIEQAVENVISRMGGADGGGRYFPRPDGRAARPPDGPSTRITPSTTRRTSTPSATSCGISRRRRLQRNRSTRRKRTWPRWKRPRRKRKPKRRQARRRQRQARGARRRMRRKQRLTVRRQSPRRKPQKPRSRKRSRQRIPQPGRRKARQSPQKPRSSTAESPPSRRTVLGGSGPRTRRNTAIRASNRCFRL